MRRALRWLLWAVALPVLLCAVLVAALWGWSGSDGSLATVLRQAPRFLPADVVLSAEDVKGALRHGGTVGVLRVEANGHAVEARNVSFAWRPTALWNRHLQLDQLHIGDLQVQPAPPSPEPLEPLTQLVLPLQISTHVRIDKVGLRGATPLDATALDLNYRYDGKQHALSLNSLQVAAGRYKGQATLGGNAPLALEARVHANVRTTVPGSTQSLTLLGQASVVGTLAGRAAVLDVQAALNTSGATPKGSVAPHMSATAQLSPWADQPVSRADAQLQGIDLAALWPQAPNTRLSGSVQVAPSGGATAQPSASQLWRITVQMRNDDAGPWDQKKLPLNGMTAKARALQQASAPLTVIVDALQMQVAGGQLEGTGQWQSAGPTPWQGDVTLRGINPAQAYATLAPAALDGQVKALAMGQGLSFELALKPSTQQPVSTALASLPGVTLRAAEARGTWGDGTLKLDALRIQTNDALIQGQIQVQPTTQAADADLRLALPGAEGRVRGALAPLHGTGDVTLNLTDAARAMRWARPILTALQGATATAALPAIQGQANITANWQGGWKDPAALALRAQLDVPSLDVALAGTPAQAPVRIRQAQLQASGRLNALSLSTRAAIETRGHGLTLQVQASGGRTGTGTWAGRIGSLQAQASLAGRTGTWTLALQQAVSVQWAAVQGGSALEAGAGEARLSGPVPGQVSLAWTPVRARMAPQTALTLQSVGRLSGLPLAWLDLLGDKGGLLSNAGLKGDLIFDGSWDVQLGEQLKLQAALARRSGDISLRLDDELPGQAAFTQAAGVRTARLKFDSDGKSVNAELEWDSANAGQIQARAGTEIARQDGAWAWPPEARLSGNLRAKLPRVGAWTALAPPGWRMRGTLDAQATIAGTRADPQWRGNLSANELSLRSVVEGIDLTGGKLRAIIIGQRLDIEEFSFQGAGPDGGQLVAKGFAQWLPATRPGATTATLAAAPLTRVRIDLNAKATGLRVASRADRRLALSGDLRARLEDTRLTVRGGLSVDSALFILPDQSTPSLSDDVIVRGRTTPPPPPQTGNAVRVIPDVSVTLDLGKDFKVQGRGLSSRLAGELNLRNATLDGHFVPRLSGEVRTVKGSYKAYGQQLDIDQGVLRFAGAYDNPGLDVRAIRPNLTQRVGVEITGTVLAPRIRLYSDPSLPDAEALAWLVLGRSPTGGGAEAAVLQQAALALLGGTGPGVSGTVKDALGLDELSFRGASSQADGTAASAAVTLGKRLSSDFYVAYERSLASTLGTFYIFYDLSRYFTLRAQTGETSAVDLIFTAPYD